MSCYRRWKGSKAEVFSAGKHQHRPKPIIKRSPLVHSTYAREADAARRRVVCGVLALLGPSVGSGRAFLLRRLHSLTIERKFFAFGRDRSDAKPRASRRERRDSWKFHRSGRFSREFVQRAFA